MDDTTDRQLNSRQISITIYTNTGDDIKLGNTFLPISREDPALKFKLNNMM
jgi:hypothetical protein